MSENFFKRSVGITPVMRDLNLLNHILQHSTL